MPIIVTVSPPPAAATLRAGSLLRRLLDTREDLGMLVARVVLGSVMAAHGAQKLLGWFGGSGLETTLGSFSEHLGIPRPLGILVVLTEVLGGIGLVLGCFGRLAAAGIVAVMTGAILLVHAQNGFFMNWFGKQNGEGIEYHLLAIALAVAVMIRGSGAWSLDRRLRHHVH